MQILRCLAEHYLFAKIKPMRKFIHYGFLGTALVAMTLTSCKKDSNSDDNNGGGGGNVTTADLTTGQAIIKAKISGAYTTEYESALPGSAALKMNDQILLSSTTALQGTTKLDQLLITLPANIQSGTYKLKDLEQATIVFNHANTIGALPDTWSASAAGESVLNVTITKMTGSEIEGNFNGEMMSSSNGGGKITATGSFAGKF